MFYLFLFKATLLLNWQISLCPPSVLDATDRECANAIRRKKEVLS